MPILGLFPSAVEQQRRKEAEGIARRGAMSAGSNAANVAIQQGVGQARKGAFAQAYQNRSNPALAQRQAQEAATSATMQGAGQVAQIRAGDVNQARQDISAMDAERNAGINSAIGFGAQALGTAFGGPAGGAAAGGVANALTSEMNPTAPPGGAAAPPKPGLFANQGLPFNKPPPAAASGAQAPLSVTEDPQGALGTPPVPAQAAPQISQVNPAFVTPPPAITAPMAPAEPPPAAGIAALYERAGNQRDPRQDIEWRRRWNQQYGAR